MRIVERAIIEAARRVFCERRQYYLGVYRHDGSWRLVVTPRTMAAADILGADEDREFTVTVVGGGYEFQMVA